MKDIITNTHKAYYDDPGKWGRPYHRINLDRAKWIAQAIPRNAKKILDLGAGDGLVFNTLKKAGYDPVAFDISRIALKCIKGDKLVQGTASNLPFFSNSFDLILACEVLEHIPNIAFKSVLEEIVRISKRYVLITVPYREKLELNYARCQACGCVFNGSYHVRSFNRSNIKNLFSSLKCIRLNRIISVLNPDRTLSLELYIRQHMANEYLYIGPSVKCPLCSSLVNEKPDRNWIGWIASGIRYLYRIFDKRTIPLWYLAVYQKMEK
jgi:2-polyprenyl-3-methyl-5-hydroxy-6-metoxy-1,4-benzoquinol methylase